jgi:hypothetical protein
MPSNPRACLRHSSLPASSAILDDRIQQSICLSMQAIAKRELNWLGIILPHGSEAKPIHKCNRVSQDCSAATPKTALAQGGRWEPSETKLWAGVLVSPSRNHLPKPQQIPLQVSFRIRSTCDLEQQLHCLDCGSAARSWLVASSCAFRGLMRDPYGGVGLAKQV